MATGGYTEVQQAQTISDAAGTWAQTVDFGQFDPSLGDLLDINVGLIGSVSGSVAIENLEAAPAVFSIALPGQVHVLGPAGSSLANTVLAAVAPEVLTSVTLGAFDGTLDYGGVSGTTLGGLSNSATQAIVLQAGSLGSDPFVGTGTVALPVTASTSLEVTGPANMQIQSQASAGAVVTLDYNYGTSDNGESSGSGSVADEYEADLNGLYTIGLATPTQTLAVADQTTGWSTSVAAEQFAPSLGELVAVSLTVSTDIAASVAAANLDPTAGMIATAQTATVTLLAPGDTLTADAAVSSYGTMAATDGSSAFSGPSAFIAQGLTAGPVAGGSFLTGEGDITTDLSAYIGTGTIDLPLVSGSAATLDGPGNLLAQLLAQSGAVVTISYDYLPPPVLSAPAAAVDFVPGGTVLAGSGITLTDQATSTITSATVAISSGWQSNDALSANTGGTGIDAAFSDGTLTLSGTASLAAYQQVLQSVGYSSSAADPTAGGNDTTRTLSWSVTDSDGLGAVPATSTIDVQMPATFVSTADEDVTIAQPGTYTIESVQSAHALVLDSPGATLVLDASLNVAAGFTLEAGTLAFDSGTLSVGTYDQTGGVVEGNAVNIDSTGTMTIDGGSMTVTGGTVTVGAGSSLVVGGADGAGGAVTADNSGAAAVTGVVLTPLTTFVPLVPATYLDDGAGMVSLAAVPVILPLATITPAAASPTPVVVPAVAMSPVAPSEPSVTIATPVTVHPAAMTAEALGLDPTLLGIASGVGPHAPDVWQMMTQDDIVGAGSVLHVLQDPAVNAWVALTVQPGAALSTGVVAGGGPIATLSAFLTAEQNHLGQSTAAGGL